MLQHMIHTTRALLALLCFCRAGLPSHCSEQQLHRPRHENARQVNEIKSNAGILCLARAQATEPCALEMQPCTTHTHPGLASAMITLQVTELQARDGAEDGAESLKAHSLADHHVQARAWVGAWHMWRHCMRTDGAAGGGGRLRVRLEGKGRHRGRCLDAAWHLVVCTQSAQPSLSTEAEGWFCAANACCLMLLQAVGGRATG